MSLRASNIVVVPVLLLVIEVSKAEADADWRYYKTLAERAAGIGQSLDEFLAQIVDGVALSQLYFRPS